MPAIRRSVSSVAAKGDSEEGVPPEYNTEDPFGSLLESELVANVLKVRRWGNTREKSAGAQPSPSMPLILPAPPQLSTMLAYCLQVAFVAASVGAVVGLVYLATPIINTTVEAFPGSQQQQQQAVEGDED